MDMTALPMRLRGEFARAIANKRFEITPAGILFPQQGVLAAGVFDVEHRRQGDFLGREIGPNVIPTEGLDHILNAIAHGTSQVNPWYVALFEGNVTPGASLTGPTFDSVCTECTAYDETTRVEFNEAASSGGIMSNAANRAVFTMNASKTVYGGALLSSQTKEDTTSGIICLAAAKFATSRAVVSGDELAVKYTLTFTSS